MGYLFFLFLMCFAMTPTRGLFVFLLLMFYCDPNKWVICFLLLMCFTVSPTSGSLVLFFIVDVFYSEPNKWVIFYFFIIDVFTLAKIEDGI